MNALLLLLLGVAPVAQASTAEDFGVGCARISCPDVTFEPSCDGTVVVIIGNGHCNGEGDICQGKVMVIVGDGNCQATTPGGDACNNSTVRIIVGDDNCKAADGEDADDG